MELGRQTTVTVALSVVVASVVALLSVMTCLGVAVMATDAATSLASQGKASMTTG